MRDPARAESVYSKLDPEEKYLYAKAVRRLGVHDDTCRGLYERLKRESFEDRPADPECAKRVIALLVREGFLNERRYCEELTRRLVRSGYGPRRVEAELKRRRFAPAVIERTLRESGERAQIDEVLQKRFALRPTDLETRKGRAKLYQYLVRMGFSGSDAQNAVDRLKADPAREEDEL